jgi:hypothetical protein
VAGFWAVQFGYLASLWLFVARFEYRYYSTVYDIDHLQRQSRINSTSAAGSLV